MKRGQDTEYLMLEQALETEYWDVCPVCSGEVAGHVCRKCGWDEFGGNVFFHRPQGQDVGEAS